MSKTDSHNQLLRALPSVDAVLKTETAQRLVDEVGIMKLTSLARVATDALRNSLLNKTTTGAVSESANDAHRSLLLKAAEERLLQLHEIEAASGLKRVINATGVILHTNLGRAPLSAAARQAIAEVSGYCTLEYDTVSGARGGRGARAEALLVDVTGAEAALIVNNCAAAALLILNTFARDGETVVSRGELVEIGGDFRVPEVMAQSGTRMIEVGTTNRTRLADYQKAISDHTRMIMRVHTSNYRIVGFTKTPALPELAELAHKSGLLIYEDAGSGALFDFGQFGIEGEPVIRQSLNEGADLVSFSGDKLLGGPQAGMIVGHTPLIERVRKNPLYRALRADKLRLAALEATLAEYSRNRQPPVIEMIAMPLEQIAERAKKLARKINGVAGEKVMIETIPSESAVGGGSAPTSSLPTLALSVAYEGRTANQIAARLRHANPAIITRIVDDRVLIDLRTVLPGEEVEIERALCVLSEPNQQTDQLLLS
jgi:L-seryl-tRNA(Ser) seleniumtransferase